MVFGGVKGFNIFHPDSITDNDIRPRTAISRLKIRNQTVSAGDSVCGRVVLPRAINRLNKLDLSYNCNNLTFEFSAFAYVDPKYNTYKYRMENFDTDWNYTSGLSPQAVYTNLRPGSYRLVVYASNEDGYWSQAPAVLEITIRPPVYATRLAWLCYIALTILFLYRWHRRSLRKLQERHQIELERNKYYEEQKSSANMLQFYTDIAHELKTPLSLITAPVEELLLNPHIGKTTRNRLELVNRNAGALKTLLEQILDLRKYESHKMELAAVQTDASEFLRGIAELFKPLADQLQIQFSQEIPNDPLILWIDRRKMEIVIANLLYNAFKYSRKSSGKVNLVCEEQQLSVTISVEDNGIGIARDEQSRIFERFYQARNNNSPQKSIGIGLSLVKHIVTLHHGEIEVASELNVGSLFRVRIPKGCAHLAPEQIKDSDKVPGRPFQNLPIGMDSALSDFGDDQFESEMAAETAIGSAGSWKKIRATEQLHLMEKEFRFSWPRTIPPCGIIFEARWRTDTTSRRHEMERRLIVRQSMNSPIWCLQTSSCRECRESNFAAKSRRIPGLRQSGSFYLRPTICRTTKYPDTVSEPTLM